MEFTTLKSDTHELIVIADDVDFQACIAIHSTKLGPALGGIRLKAYGCPTDMVTDALKLSEGMSYKNAAAGLPHGGGKSTINASHWTRDIAQKFAKFINYVNEELGVLYIGAPDMNTNNDCMYDLIEEGCRHVFYDPTGGDCSYATAYGVFNSLKAIETFLGPDTEMTINIEGVGKVGYRLAKLCKEYGYDVCVADLDETKAYSIAAELGVAYASHEDIKHLKGIYAPCAVGGTVDKAFVEETEAWAVCGAANNQLDKLDRGKDLAVHGILYIPDFIANGGGVIAIGVALTNPEPFGLRNEETCKRVEFIGTQASAMLLAQTTQIETRNAQLLAMKVAKDIIEK